MSQIINKIDFGSNIIEIIGQPVLCPVSYLLDRETGKKMHLFTVENSDKGLILTANLRDRNANRIVEIDENKIKYIDNDNFTALGELEKGEGIKITKKDDKAVIFNARIENGLVKVTGVFNFAGSEIIVTDDEVVINPGNNRLWNNYIKTDSSGITFTHMGFGF